MKNCCICEKSITGHGHNPVPVYNSKGRCCTMCNMTKVLPARLMLKDIKDGNNERNIFRDDK
jgi:carbamoylphosphate synthase large subunit